MTKIIKDGEIIKSEEVAQIIKTHGFVSVIENGAFVECDKEELLQVIKGLEFIANPYHAPQIVFKDGESVIEICLVDTVKVGLTDEGLESKYTLVFPISLESKNPFKWESLRCKSDAFKTEWDDYLNGFILTFADGKRAQTQINTEQNRLHADFGESYLERYTEYDDELTQEQHELVDLFVQLANKIKFNQ